MDLIGMRRAAMVVVALALVLVGAWTAWTAWSGEQPEAILASHLDRLAPATPVAAHRSESSAHRGGTDAITPDVEVRPSAEDLSGAAGVAILVVRVVGPDHAPLPGARAAIDADPDEAFDPTAERRAPAIPCGVAGPDGIVRLAIPFPGVVGTRHVFVWARAKGHAPAFARLHVREGARAETEVRLVAEARCRGTVVDEAGVPVGGAIVWSPVGQSLHTWSPVAAAPGGTTTAPDGTFDLGELAEGWGWYVSVRAQDRRTEIGHRLRDDGSAGRIVLRSANARAADDPSTRWREWLPPEPTEPSSAPSGVAFAVVDAATGQPIRRFACAIVARSGAEPAEEEPEAATGISGLGGRRVSARIDAVEVALEDDAWRWSVPDPDASDATLAWTFWFRARGTLPARVDVGFLPPGVRRALTVRLVRAESAVDGIVRSRVDGAALRDVVISPRFPIDASEPDDEALTAHPLLGPVVSGADGRFRLPFAGEVPLALEIDGGAAAHGTATVRDIRPGTPVDVSLEPAGLIEGTLRDPAGGPVAYASLGLGPRFGQNPLAISDTRGGFQIEHVDAGRHTLFASRRGRSAVPVASIEVVPGRTTRVEARMPDGVVRLRLVWPDGAPALRHSPVSLMPQEPGAGYPVEGFVGSDGEVTLHDVPSGVYRLSLGPRTVAKAEGISPGNPGAPRTVTLAPAYRGHRVRVAIRCETGDPAPAERLVWLYDATLEQRDAWRTQPVGGVAEFHDLPAGRYVVVACDRDGGPKADPVEEARFLASAWFDVVRTGPIDALTLAPTIRVGNALQPAK